MDISGKTKLFAIIGDPVAGVVSPPAINAWFKANGVDAYMVAMNIPASNIAAFWDVLRASDTVLKRYAKNLNHLKLPEIRDFNALDDERCLKYFVKRYRLLDHLSA